MIDGVPILINESSSIFSINDFLNKKDTFFNLTETKIEDKIKKIIPDISKNLKAEQNYDKFAKLLLVQSTKPKVLLIGGGILGKGLDTLLSYPQINLVETDVSFGPRIILVCDAHDIPFEDSTFDGVIIQAVLEHVIDPYRCVEEIFRVTKKDGLIYSEIPFMQQVHGGRQDFTRFTYLGHLTSFYLKYLDYYLINKVGSLDAASGLYFLGRKNDKVLTDKELIKCYKGNIDKDLNLSFGKS